jgi:uncharacterized protein (TIGR02246 family)
MCTNERGREMSTRGLLTTLALLSLASVAEGQDATAALDALHKRSARWYAERMHDSLSLLYADDGAIFVPNRPPITGREAIAAHWKNMFTGYRWDVRLETVSVITDGAIAVERGRYHIVMTATGATSPFATDRGNYVTTWTRTADGWRIRYDVSMSELPRPPSAR